jgi:hypothetical protein
MVKKYLTVFIFALLFAGCGASTSLGELEVETPKGDKVGCVTDYGACTQTCYGTRNGFKVKKVTPLSPKVCLEAKGEAPEVK